MVGIPFSLAAAQINASQKREAVSGDRTKCYKSNRDRHGQNGDGICEGPYCPESSCESDGGLLGRVAA